MATKSPSSLIDTHVIYCGDILDQLRKFPAGCVDLICIDLPFNSNRNYEGSCGETKRCGLKTGANGAAEVLVRTGRITSWFQLDAIGDDPPQLKPFAIGTRESVREKQTEML
jgi:hypothetical protein